jgi:hypothetical protein
MRAPSPVEKDVERDPPGTDAVQGHHNSGYRTASVLGHGEGEETTTWSF